jgi:hypothetical protein
MKNRIDADCLVLVVGFGPFTVVDKLAYGN